MKLHTCRTTDSECPTAERTAPMLWYR